MKILKKMLYTLLIIIAVLVVGGIIFINQPQFGKNPSRKRLERIKKSPNYKNGEFQNLTETPVNASGKSYFTLFWETFFKKSVDASPKAPIPSVKTDLRSLKNNDFVWLGHSSYIFKIDNKTYLIDPVLYNASPMPWSIEPFNGADIYQPEDLPAVDFLIITHDHYDHLDYKTISKIKDNVGKVITPLGVGEHLEYWGISADKITEMDWYEQTQIAENTHLNTLPARHGSGRSLKQKQTLWASFMLQTPSETIYIGGDSGYDTFFKEIGEKYPKIDWAILENGQYDQNWRYIHFLPEDLVKAVKDLKPHRLLAFHNSKYALAKHPWYEPLEKIAQASEKEKFNLATPKIGEIVRLDDDTQTFEKWWR